MMVRSLFLLASLIAHGVILVSPIGFNLQMQKPPGEPGIKVRLVRSPAASNTEVAIPKPPQPMPTERQVIAEEILVQQPDPSEFLPVPELKMEPKPLPKRLTTKNNPKRKPVAEVSTPRKRLAKPTPKPRVKPLLQSNPQPVQVASLQSEMRLKSPVPVERSQALSAVTISAEQQDIAAVLPDLELAYRTALLKLIESNKKYPMTARRKGQEGVVLVGFVVSKDGAITMVDIINRSEHRRLDRAATRLLEKIGRFEPIPDVLNKERWAFQVPIRYSLR